MEKFDLIMWTYNSHRTLDESLSSLEAAIPDARICHRIMVDGGSIDSTGKIAKKHGWEFYQTKPGIPVQANFGLKLVDTEKYASFEHDIVLSRSWLARMEMLLGPEDVAVAQGIRISKGVASLEALDRWSFSHRNWFYSLDNTMYRTDSIRKLGGYPLDCPMTADGFLRRNILAHGLKWITDTQCISWHLRSTFADYLRHVIAHIAGANYLWETETPRHISLRLLKIFSTSPVVGASMAAKSHTPSLSLDYPLFRYVLLVTMSVLAREKTVLVVPGIDETSKFERKTAPCVSMVVGR